MPNEAIPITEHYMAFSEAPFLPNEGSNEAIPITEHKYLGFGVQSRFVLNEKLVSCAPDRPTVG